MKDIHAVLFDMDGLLLDDERINIECCIELGREWGFELDPTAVARAVMGSTRATVVSCYARVLPEGTDAQLFFDSKRDRLHERFRREGIKPMKGAVELLKWLGEHGVPCVLATSTSIDLATQRLRTAGIYDYLQYYITGDMVTHSKPDPEIYLKAAAAAGVPIEKCLVLEDSYHGILSGRASGAIVGMVPDMLPYDESCADSVDVVFDSLLDVIDWISD